MSSQGHAHSEFVQILHEQHYNDMNKLCSKQTTPSQLKLGQAVSGIADKICPVNA